MANLHPTAADNAADSFEDEHGLTVYDPTNPDAWIRTDSPVALND